MGRLRQLTAQQAEKILKQYGFELVSQKGSHRKWRSLERKLQVVVPFHKGKTLPAGTLRSIMTSADIPETEWKTD
ncbi:type II toxin-antitoxin system HicA family toxin [Leptolyngbya sp. CCNP1308]|uniref:type II toxin-antitoxin system HicA family toxin n=1 Tax=Leptolyngbya sp. CCNP1308 TaxID=3110255 RepID=UPI003A599464